MSNVKMPEPVAYLSCNTQTGQPEWSEDCVCQDNVYSVMETGTIGRPVIFADQTEAYKDACVREALETVIQNLEKESDKARHFQAYAAVLALMSQAELIRISLDTKESKNGVD